MPRPKKGTPEAELANARWRATMNERYGSVSEKMKAAGAIGGKAKVPKGFALMTPEKRSAAGAKGGSARKGYRKNG